MRLVMASCYALGCHPPTRCIQVALRARGLDFKASCLDWGGIELFNTWTYSLVDPGHRLEFVLRFADRERNVLSPQSLGIPLGVPAAVPHILTFVELDDHRSTLTVTELGYTSAQALEASQQGLQQTLDKLAEALRL